MNNALIFIALVVAFLLIISLPAIFKSHRAVKH